MLDICKEHLSMADRRQLDADIETATRRALAKTAWRIEGTLREFARFDPVNLWFDYPVHKLDTGLLEDLQPESDFRALGAKGAAKRWPGGKEGAAQKSRKDLSNAFEACMMDGEVTIYSMAEYMDSSPAPSRRDSRLMVVLDRRREGRTQGTRLQRVNARKYNISYLYIIRIVIILQL